ncbi:hypothetical protein PACTADRAFT_51820 [Pachysolen tannophilus NRRL Y-2460]|uniref:cAMP-dependent protein kinase regulatory subunit n=1 Tax=Pachysolen tannophilus NRRL Y-2460 TaxID=669874 RepID=A0A1E4TN68_PACTA|nr:hypothetical protein PACTADRAFT_51820 [Pachysolen tannophilus NRRL Y-2460]
MASLNSQYLDELNELNKQIKSKNPSDILQFCANYFNSRLEQQRSILWDQRTKAEQAGIKLFPSLIETEERRKNQTITSFKAPFGENDPHSLSNRPLEHDPILAANEVNKSTNGNPIGSGVGNVFKGGYGVGEKNTLSSSSSEVDPNDPRAPSGNFGTKVANFPARFNANRRVSVSAEILNPDTFSGDSWKPPRHDITPEQLARLKKTVADNFLFSQLDEESLHTVIYALEEKKVPNGTTIIRQGDEGDFFYVLEEGSVDYFVNGVKVGSTGPGSSFGELALMYNSPRAATTIATSNCVLWALDRLTFKRILLEGTAKKRSMYEEFLKEVPVLKPLSSYARNKLADALHTEKFRPNENIVTEGERGENFYFVETGEAEIIRKDKGVIGKLHKGDYFGEVALLNDLPRQATVKAITDVTVVTLSKSGFKRLLGPTVEEILRQQDPTQSR